MAVNTNWESVIDSEDISPIIGDPVFEPGNSKDAAMILTLDPGGVKDEGGRTGRALIEVNEFDSVENTRLVNVSTPVTGDDALIGGFVIKGSEHKKVLVQLWDPRCP